MVEADKVQQKKQQHKKTTTNKKETRIKHKDWKQGNIQ